MIKESEIVTKSYLRKVLAGFVTKTYLDMRLKEQRVDIIREVRSMMHETMEGAMDNMKEYYDQQTKMHMSALMQGFKDEMRAYKDGMATLMEKLTDHERRLAAHGI